MRNRWSTSLGSGLAQYGIAELSAGALCVPRANTARITVTGAHLLWLVLQHVLPKGLRRARNFGFLHPNCKRLIALLHLLLKFVPVPLTPKQRPATVCPCCGAAMMIAKTRIRPMLPEQARPVANAGVH